MHAELCLRHIIDPVSCAWCVIVPVSKHISLSPNYCYVISVTIGISTTALATDN